ncbi:MAG TPA: bifunctional (p)ppGpp synthetase/guanosine-3',5'-bis(diphosphate) 3'-pyrophosphohydrolase [Bryobacteraceae bacterium]|jgi:GTP pyrophosphokinase|nr:bifunctional (p)ppGpp synthetase/guanosine-3',5'-bis(diphosphate) 3'-pyrophosphohydrolase [Bryobacteraceae bacterium]
MSTGVLELPPQVEELYRTLEDKVRVLWPKEDLTGLERAYRFAAEHHKQQKRKSGEPYIAHPLAVAHILADMQMDLVCLQTGLLHDVVEDTSARLDEVKEQFGENVARCVDGVTKLSKISLANREDRQAESLRKMLLAMTGDIRVIIVKLADRLHNMRTIESLARERQEAIAQETLDIYAPIAHRLGMGKIRGELEDLAFETLHPEESAELMREIESKRHEHEDWLRQLQTQIEQKLSREDIPARVEGRVKRAYSVYQKLKRQKITLDQVYDVLAVRIITDSVKNCYAALGVIHNDWHPIPGRIKDFIAMPRPNLYQSLHTSVIGPGGMTFEVQIRTAEMHRIAEEGIAAHWKYKEGSKGPGGDDQRIAWMRQLVEWQSEMRDSGDFLSTLKVDLYSEEVYTFTPRGRVMVLPRDATPIDFAYAIHSDVGNTCVGARVNGSIKPLRYVLRNGDVVEILTQPGHQPSRDWLGLVKTSRARNKIKHLINAVERAKAVEIGQKSLEKEARRMGVSLGRISSGDLESVASEYGVSKTEDLYAALGFGKFSARQVLQKVAPEDVPPAEVAAPAPSISRLQPEPGGPIGDGDLAIHVKGADDVMVYRAKCCNPIRGEQIVGYITRGKGVAVHSAQCPNVQNLMYEAERKIGVEWARSASDPLPVKVVIYTDDRPGILHQLTSILNTESTNIRTLEARGDTSRTDESAIVDITMDVRDKKQLERVITAFRRIPGVRDIERVPTAQ